MRKRSSPIALMFLARLLQTEMVYYPFFLLFFCGGSSWHRLGGWLASLWLSLLCRRLHILFHYLSVLLAVRWTLISIRRFDWCLCRCSASAGHRCHHILCRGLQISCRWCHRGRGAVAWGSENWARCVQIVLHSVEGLVIDGASSVKSAWFLLLNSHMWSTTKWICPLVAAWIRLMNWSGIWCLKWLLKTRSLISVILVSRRRKCWLLLICLLLHIWNFEPAGSTIPWRILDRMVVRLQSTWSNG